MEFERALFRIHQRSLQSEPLRKARLQLERILPVIVAILAMTLAVLHGEYVGQARCIPDTMRRVGFWNETTSSPSLPDDIVLAISVVDQEDLSEMTLQIKEGRGSGSVAARTGAGSSVSAAGSSATATVSGTGVVVGSENATVLKGRPSFDAVLDSQNVLLSYKFVLDREILLLPKETFDKHGFQVRNVTLSERCMAPSLFVAFWLRFFFAYDNLVINELAYGLRSRGYLERMDGDSEAEAWAWTEEQVESAWPKAGRSLMAALWRKGAILLKSVATFILISAMTGLFIRVAVNGSAVLMFPIAAASLSLGLGSGRMSTAVLTRSFPWIGVHVEVLRRANRPLWPLFRSHLVFLFLQSFAYLSCNLAWRFILYRKSSPEGFEERIFSFCSVLELFNLIFVRSENSVVVFPKLALCCMVYLHFYMFCALYPFHSLALALCTAVCFYAMVYCLNHYEEPALRADPFLHSTPTAAHPRAVYVPQLSPSWTVESAPLWTMFFLPDRADAFPEEAMRHISNEEFMMA